MTLEQFSIGAIGLVSAAAIGKSFLFNGKYQSKEICDLHVEQMQRDISEIKADVKSILEKTK